MFMCEIWIIRLFFPLFCKSDMPKFEYLEAFQREALDIRDNDSRLYNNI